MEIVYCENCGSRIPEADINSGKAVKSAADYFCPDCVTKLGIRPDPPEPKARRKTPRPVSRPRSATRTPPRGMQGAAPARARGTRRPQGSARRQAAARGAGPAQAPQSTALLAAGAAFAAFAVTLAIIFLLGAKKKKVRRKKPAPLPQAPVDVRREEPKPPSPTSLFAPHRRPDEEMLPPPPPVSPLPPPVSRTPAGPDLEKIKLSGEDWLKNRAGTCPKSYLEVPRAPGPPVIDGDLTDPCWKEAARAAEFTWGPENVPIPEGVTVLICYDDSAVYVAFECKDPDIDNVMRKATETRESVWDDDSVELFFDANRDYGTYVQLLANVDAVTQTYENVGGKPKETPIQGFEVKTKLYPYHWAVEFSLSYAALRGNSPRPGTVWTAQFVRNGRAPEAAKNYSGSWAKLWAGSTHRPETFGFLAFK